jgi:hypothetical protein
MRLFSQALRGQSIAGGDPPRDHKTWIELKRGDGTIDGFGGYWTKVQYIELSIFYN